MRRSVIMGQKLPNNDSRTCRKSYTTIGMKTDKSKIRNKSNSCETISRKHSSMLETYLAEIRDESPADI